MSINPAGSPAVSSSYSGLQGTAADNAQSAHPSESLPAAAGDESPEKLRQRLNELKEDLNKLCFEVDGSYPCRFALEPELTASIRESLGIREAGAFMKALQKAGPAGLALLTAGAAVTASFIAAGIGGLAVYGISRYILHTFQEKKDLKVDALLYPQVEERYKKVSEEVYRLERKLSGEERNETEWDACSYGAGLKGSLPPGEAGGLTSKNISRALSSRLTAEHLWQYRPDGYEHRFDTAPAVAADGTVYTATMGGRIIALRDGKPLWNLDTGKGITTSPAAGPDGQVYAYSQDGTLFAARDGKICWEFNTEESPSCAAPVVGPDGTVYTGGSRGKLVGVKDGQKVWEYDAGGFIQKPFFLADGTMIVGNSEHVLAFRNGSKIWEFDDNSSYGVNPAPGPDGSVLVMGKSSKLHAVKDGKSLWNIPIDMRNDPCTGPDGTVYVSSYEHSRSTICAIRDGKIAWEVDLIGKTVASAPSVGPDNTVYAHNGTKTLFAMKDGKKLWKAHIGVEPPKMGPYRIAEDSLGIMTPPVPGPDNTIYVNSYSRIFAVKDNMAASGATLSETGDGDSESTVFEDDGWLNIDGLKLSVNPADLKDHR